MILIRPLDKSSFDNPSSCNSIILALLASLQADPLEAPKHVLRIMERMPPSGEQFNLFLASPVIKLRPINYTARRDYSSSVGAEQITS